MSDEHIRISRRECALLLKQVVRDLDEDWAPKQPHIRCAVLRDGRVLCYTIKGIFLAATYPNVEAYKRATRRKVSSYEPVTSGKVYDLSRMLSSSSLEAARIRLATLTGIQPRLLMYTPASLRLLSREMRKVAIYRWLSEEDGYPLLAHFGEVLRRAGHGSVKVEKGRHGEDVTVILRGGKSVDFASLVLRELHDGAYPNLARLLLESLRG